MDEGTTAVGRLLACDAMLGGLARWLRAAGSGLAG